MSTSDDVRQLAAGIAALPADDPQRLEAYRAAEADPELARALAEGERLMELLALAELEPPPEAVMLRVEKMVLAEMEGEAQTATSTPLWGRLALMLSTLVVPVLLLTKHGVDFADPRTVWAGGLMALALIAAGALSWIGRPLAGLSIAAGGFFSLLVGQGSIGDVGAGMKCFSMELVSAAAPLAMAVVLGLRGKLRGGPLLFGGAATVGALAGMAALHLECPGTSLGHLLVYHAAGVAGAALIGIGVGATPALRRASR